LTNSGIKSRDREHPVREQRQRGGRKRGIEEEEIACRHTTACNFLTTLLCLEEQNAEEGEGKGENWGGS